jgi:hypothetical protein
MSLRLLAALVAEERSREKLGKRLDMTIVSDMAQSVLEIGEGTSIKL